MEQSGQKNFQSPAHRDNPPVDSTAAEMPLQTTPIIRSDASVREAVDQLNKSNVDYLPLLDPKTGEVAGILLKPGTSVYLPPAASTKAPRLGGMATPLGVYLHDGVSGGGAGFIGLALSGALLAFLGVITQFVTEYFANFVDTTVFAWMARSPHLASVLQPFGIGADQLVLSVFSVCLLLSFVRLLPLSGTHAAEHQVVHCVEQGVPLTVRYVRAMPRVHPRCGTNLLTGLVLFVTLFVTIFKIAVIKNVDTWDASALAVLVSGPVSLAYWRRIGGFMQYWLATKPATDAQIEGAIRAANEVLEKRGRRSEEKVRFRLPRRIWAMGIPQVLTGYAVVYLLLRLVDPFLVNF